MGESFQTQIGMGGRPRVTVAILAQGTHWAVAAKQAFCPWFDSLRCLRCSFAFASIFQLSRHLIFFLRFLVDLALFGQVSWYKRISLHDQWVCCFGPCFYWFWRCSAYFRDIRESAVLVLFGQGQWYKRLSLHDLRIYCFSTCFYWFWCCSGKVSDISDYLCMICESTVSALVLAFFGRSRWYKRVSLYDLRIYCFSTCSYWFWRSSGEVGDINLCFFCSRSALICKSFCCLIWVLTFCYEPWFFDGRSA